MVLGFQPYGHDVVNDLPSSVLSEMFCLGSFDVDMVSPVSAEICSEVVGGDSKVLDKDVQEFLGLMFGCLKTALT